MNKSSKQRFAPKQSMQVKRQTIGDNMIPIAGKKTVVHSKNPYFIRKPDPFAKTVKPQTELDGFFILDKTGCSLTHQVIFLKASGKNIVTVNERDLDYFVNLTELDLSENSLRDFNGLHVLKQLTKLYVQNNRIEIITFSPERYLEHLQVLDLSYNKVQHDTIKNLFYLPSLKTLHLAGNELAELPYDLSHFRALEELDLHSNRFRSDTFTTRFWFSLSTIPKLKVLSVARNQLRGIHTEKLKAGDFGNIERLDFSHNICDNQHNLICARNFKNLQILTVTGNPFAVMKQHRGLEMEIYTRVGAVLINEDMELPYLRKKKLMARPGIDTSNFTVIPPDDFGKENRPTFFGVELPKRSEVGMEMNEGVTISPPDLNDDAEQEEEQDELELENAEKFFLTENQTGPGGKQGTSGIQHQEHPRNRANEAEDLDEQEEEEYSRNNYLHDRDDFEQTAQQTNIDFASIKDTQALKREAGKLMGDTKEYDTPIDLQQAYKILKGMVHRQTTTKIELRGETLSKPKFNKINAPRIGSSFSTGQFITLAQLGKQQRKKEATLMDVEMLIDNLHRKVTNEVHGNP